MLPTLVGFAALCLLAAAPAAAADDPLLDLYFGEARTVESATRSPKPLARVAENVTVVTADEIRAMNAHTLADVLNRVTGVYVDAFGNHPGATALAHIQGSGEPNGERFGHEDRHVLVLLDGIPWSSETGGPYLDLIPVGVIERIEVIKGPASAAWGSSLGGVVNVLTKQPGAASPWGELAAAGGERNAWDGRAEAAGGGERGGVYLQGQVQNADWAEDDGGYEGKSAYASSRLALGDGVMLRLAAGETSTAQDAGHLESGFALSQSKQRADHVRIGLDATPSAALGLHLDLYRFAQRIDQFVQEDGAFAPRGDLLFDNHLGEEHLGAQARVTWRSAHQQVVAGLDYRNSRLETRNDFGEFFQSLGNPPRFDNSGSGSRWGLYLNDTVTVGPLAMTPGVRLDGGSLVDPFLSPSLGATLGLGRAGVLRAAVARGFAAPPLGFLTVPGNGFDPNPDLEPEEIWSYQAGFETAAIPYLWLKLSGFRHEVGHAIRSTASNGPNTSTWENQGTIWRTGWEAEAETARFGGFGVRGGFAYVNVQVSGREADQAQHQANLGLFYDPNPSFHLEAFGHYVWWDFGVGAEEGKHNDFLWDLNTRKTFTLPGGPEADLFATVHNLFNGDQEVDTDRGQEPRWVEAGVRVRF